MNAWHMACRFMMMQLAFLSEALPPNPKIWKEPLFRLPLVLGSPVPANHRDGNTWEQYMPDLP